MLLYIKQLSSLTIILLLYVKGQVSEITIPIQLIINPKITAETRQSGDSFVKQSQTERDSKAEADRLFETGIQQFRKNQYQEALENYRQVLLIRQQLGDRVGIGKTTYEIGAVYERMGNYPQALEFYQQSLTVYRRLDDKAGIGKTLNQIGKVYSLQGQYYQSLKLLEQALIIQRQIDDKAGIATTLNNIGTAYEGLSQYSQALDFYRQSLTIFRDVDNKIGVGRTLNNIGLVYSNLGQNIQAIEFYQQALVVRREIGDRIGEGKTLHNIGLAYGRLGQYSEAVKFYQQALDIRREVRDIVGMARTFNSIGFVYSQIGKYSQALEVLEQGLRIFQQLGDKAGIAKTLDSLGDVYAGLKQFPKALGTYQQALAVTKEVGDRRVERIILSNIGELLSNQNQPELAIIFYKESVNITESIRSDLRSLPVEQQRSYTTTVADTYRHLADLLLQQDRILEAQQVLDLLKIQEIEDYLHSVRGNQQTAQGIPLSTQEQQIQNRYYNEILNKEIQVGRRLAELEKIPEANRTSEQQQEIVNLRQIQQEMRGTFNDFIKSPEIVAIIQQLSPNARVQTVNLAQLNTIRGDLLQRLEKKAVLIQPLILEDRLELVITTADAPPFRRTVTVKKQDLYQAILEFRIALEDPKSDATIPAKKLYDWLIKPLEKDLSEAEVKSIIYAPDGQLRYIPLAALYDGEQWLGQRFAVNNITAFSLTKFTRKTASQPRVLAGAFAAGRYNFERGSTRFAFSGLQFAGLEVENLATMMPGTTKLIDRDFNRATMIPRLPDYTIVHLATHAMFVTGQPEDSFILLGNGDLITLPDIQTLNLLNVDLVVLSACQTGIGGKLGNGEEILGFGYQIQETGAKAAIASLWKVDDGGTQALMTAFYTALQSGTNRKAEALQKAQIALITGDDSVLGQSQNLSILAKTRSSLRQSVASRLSHPYYWASFILIGNGL